MGANVEVNNVDGFIYRIGSLTKTIGRPPLFYDSCTLTSMGNKFCSLYSVRLEDAEAIEEAGTAAGFRGIVWSQRLWIDLDTQEASTSAQTKIKELGYDYVIYDTGNRGVHIGIARDTHPSHTLPQQDKAWVQANIPGADLSLYWHLHLIRLPGVVHEKTGRPKKLVEQGKGKALILPKWNPEEDINIRGNKGLISSQDSQRESIFSSWKITQNLMPTGLRRQLVELAMSLNEQQVTLEECMWVVKEVNKGFSVPRDDNDIERIVNWVYNEKANNRP